MLVFYRIFGKSGPSYDTNQNILFIVRSYRPNTGSEALWKDSLQAAGEYPEACAKTLDVLFAPPGFIGQPLQSHVRAVCASGSLVFHHSAEDP